MEALLIDEWTRAGDFLDVHDEASIAVMRERAREIGRARGIDRDTVERAALVVSEIGTNQLRHARNGRLAVRPFERGAAVGLEVVGADAGAGIVDLATALEARVRSQGSLGVGLGSIRRLAAEVDFDIRGGEGTRIAARVFAASEDRPAARRREVAIQGKPFPGERVSGDHAAFHRGPDALSFVVCDGLGHGPQARLASACAIGVFLERPNDPLERLLEEAHQRMVDTRGGVLVIGRLSEPELRLEVVSVGNVEVHLCRDAGTRRLGGSSAVVGARGRPLRAGVEVTQLAEKDVIVVLTDGIVPARDLLEDPRVLHQPAALLAQRLIERAKTTDDALVLAAR